MKTVVKGSEWWEYQLQAVKAAYGKGEAAAAAATFLVQTLPILPGQRVLDMGCGYGAVVRRLAFTCPSVQVVGIDTCKKLISLCKGYALKNAWFYRGNMFHLVAAQKYDVVLILGAIVGMFTHERNQELLRVAANALAPGGTLVLQQPDPLRYMRAVEPGYFRAERPEGTYYTTVTYNSILRQSKARFTLVTPGGARYEQEGPEFLRVYTCWELIEMLKEAELPLARAYDSMEIGAKPYFPGMTKDMIILAKAQETNA